MNHSTNEYDLVIIGSGMVGAALAVALENTSFKIAIVDAAIHDPLKVDPRLIALNHGSINFLKHLKLFQEIAAYAAPIETVHISKKGKFGKTTLLAKELQLSELGYVIPAKYINRILYERLTSNNAIRIFQPAKLISIHQIHPQSIKGTPINETPCDPEKDDENNIEIHIEEAATQKTLTLKTKWLIGADGTHSSVRKLANIPVTHHDYQQSALVSRVQLNRAHDNIAYERFTDSGAIAMLPLAAEGDISYQCALIWTDQNEKINQLKQCAAGELITLLQTEFGYRLGRFIQLQDSAVFPLHFMQTQTRLQGHIILIGNAAHTLHPLLAQGFNVALHEVAQLTEIFNRQEPRIEAKHFLDSPMLINNLQEWNSYSFSQKITTQLSHQLNTLFSTKNIPLDFMSTCLLMAGDIFRNTKKWIAKPAVGLGG